MALSAQEKHDVVMFLGWPGKTLIEGSTNYASVVDDRLKNLNDPIEAEVRSYIDRLKGIDTKLEGATCRLAAKRVDEIELNPDEIAWLRKERIRLAKLLAALLDIAYVGPGAAGLNGSICV